MTTRLTGTGIWSGTLRYGDAQRGGRAGRRARGPRLHGAVDPRRRRRPVRVRSPTCSPPRRPPRSPPASSTSGCTTPEETAAQHAALTAEHGPRFLCGIGISHRPFIDIVKEPGTYEKPVATMAAYLDGLDAADQPLAAEDRVLAALGPKMLELARTRTAGTHPYLVTPGAHREGARRDRPRRPRGQRAGRRARDRPRPGPRHRPPPPRHVPRACRTTPTTGSARASPTTTSPTAAATASSTPSSCGATRPPIAARVQEHRDAGADHVCIQVLTDDPMGFPTEQWRALAPALTG